MNSELMKVVIRPSHGNLEDVVQVGNRGVVADQQTMPNHRAYALQRNFYLINDGVEGRYEAFLPACTCEATLSCSLPRFFLLSLSREIQMLAKPSAPRALVERPVAWKFEKLDTIRHRIIQRAGRISRPKGNLTLTMSANQALRKDLQKGLRSYQSKV
jgi:hypothetical protein